jgi:tetrachlorobenzoquinone reductase
MSLSRLKVRVHAVTNVAESIRRYELHPVGATTFPVWMAGAHIDLELLPGLTRSYSLCSDPDNLQHYAIAVALEPVGRGGSRYLFEKVNVGDTLTISVPVNNFAMSKDPGLSVFIAGGIGVTPIWSMVQSLRRGSTPWVLHYAARNRARAAFVGDIELFARQHGGTVCTYFSEDPLPCRLDLAQIFSAAPESAHFYCCGPLRLTDAFMGVARNRPQAQVHVEHFRGKMRRGVARTFSVVLARSGHQLLVPSGKTLLEVIESVGVSVPWSCREGVCGACELGVLAGTPDHHDHVLTDEERARGDRLLVCCSGALSPELVLDI